MGIGEIINKEQVEISKLNETSQMKHPIAPATNTKSYISKMKQRALKSYDDELSYLIENMLIAIKSIEDTRSVNGNELMTYFNIHINFIIDKHFCNNETEAYVLRYFNDQIQEMLAPIEMYNKTMIV